MEVIKDLAGIAAGSAIADLLKFLAGWVIQVLTEMINFVGTWWLKIGAPDMGEGTATARVQQSTLFFVGVTGVIGMVFALMRVARDQDRGSTETWLMGMVRTVLVTAIAVPMVSVLLRVTDTVSPWLVRAISGSAQEDGLGKAMGLESLVSSTMTLQMAGLILFVAPLALLGSIINAVIVIFSYGAAIALCGLLPIFAAASQTERGKKSFDKAVAWLIAVVLFKPAAAVLYGAGLALMKGINGTGESDTANALISLLTGLVVIISACVAMPAMARLLVPAVGAGPQGMGASGLAMLGGAVAIGAVTAGVGAAGAGAAAAASGGGGAASSAGAAAAETVGAASTAGSGAAAPAVDGASGMQALTSGSGGADSAASTGSRGSSSGSGGAPGAQASDNSGGSASPTADSAADSGGTGRTATGTGTGAGSGGSGSGGTPGAQPSDSSGGPATPTPGSPADSSGSGSGSGVSGSGGASGARPSEGSGGPTSPTPGSAADSGGNSGEAGNGHRRSGGAAGAKPVDGSGGPTGPGSGAGGASGAEPQSSSEPSSDAGGSGAGSGGSAAGGASGAEPQSSSGSSGGGGSDGGSGGSGAAEGYRKGAPGGAEKSAVNKQRLEFALREASRDIENGMESGNDL